jgi:hypothetical protein
MKVTCGAVLVLRCAWNPCSHPPASPCLAPTLDVNKPDVGSCAHLPSRTPFLPSTQSPKTDPQRSHTTRRLTDPWSHPHLLFFATPATNRARWILRKEPQSRSATTLLASHLSFRLPRCREDHAEMLAWRVRQHGMTKWSQGAEVS